MVNLTHNIVEEDFQRSQTSTYDLSILLGVDRLSYLVSDAQQQLLALREYQLPLNNQTTVLQQLLLDDQLLQSHFNSTTVGLFSTRFTLLPEALFEPDQAQRYLQTLVTLEEDDRLLYEKVPALEAINNYAVASPALSILEEQLNNIQCCHLSSSLLQYFLTQFDNTAPKSIFLHIYRQHIALTVVDQGQLLFHNWFGFKASPDCLYYVLLVYKQLGLQPQKHPLYLSGELVMESEIHQLLHKYIKTLHYINRPNFYGFGEQLSASFPQHFFTDLYSLKLCAS